MKRSSKELKRYAKLALEGRYGIAIMGVLAAFGINLLGNLSGRESFYRRIPANYDHEPDFSIYPVPCYRDPVCRIVLHVSEYGQRQGVWSW